MSVLLQVDSSNTIWASLGSISELPFAEAPKDTCLANFVGSVVWMTKYMVIN